MRTPVSEKLDKLYGKNIRCPYCGTKIPKFVSTCENCGISKAQIAEAIVKEKCSKKNKSKRIWSSVRPADIPFWKMAVGCLFGMFGTYCFISKRWIRGTIILGFFVAFFACGIIFPLGNIDTGISTHWLRARFNQQDLPFPPDILGLVAVILWIWDWFAVLFGWYKYPVIIKTEQNG